jgi:tRNA(Ile)-lysidine synthase
VNNADFHIDRLRSFHTIFVACSGGVDSIALVHWCHMHQLPIKVLHVNFQLRGLESNKDEDFVREFCAEWNVPVEFHTADTKALKSEWKLSTQETARKIRYDWFDEQLNKNPNSVVLTAHHADDQLEQVVLRLLSSGRILDLAGIPEERPGYLRPFLKVKKVELLDYATTHKLNWREDTSNSQTDYTRNAVRLELLPQMKQLDARTESALNKLTVEVGLLRNELTHQVRRFFNADNVPEEFLVPFTIWSDWTTLFKEVLLEEWMGSARLLVEIERMLINGRPGAQVENGNEYVLIDQDGLWFGSHARDFLAVNIDKGKSFRAERVQVIWVKSRPIDSGKLFIPENSVESTLVIRNLQKGDVIDVGGKTPKQLSKHYIDQKITHRRRKKMLILRSDEKILIEQSGLMDKDLKGKIENTAGWLVEFFLRQFDIDSKK